LLQVVNKPVVTSWIAKWLLFYDAKAWETPPGGV
jgi:hypothetical protein